MAVSLVSTGVTFPDNSTQITAATGFGFKNRLINGSMVIDQRNAGASRTITDASYVTVDRWRPITEPTSSVYSLQQNAGNLTGTNLPVGFTNYLGATVLSAQTVSGTNTYLVAQYIEGFNCADFAWGTASAQAVTISFWIRSSLTGTFGGSIQNSAENRSYPFTYTISAANTWEQKSVTIAGDTSGTWLTNNGIGLRLNFGLGVGSTRSGTAGAWAAADYRSATGATSVVGTSSATFYITGVQLEKGSTATSFDYRPFQTELQLAQRYFEIISTNADGDANRYLTAAWTTSESNCYMPFKVTKRATPTLTISANGEIYTGTWQTPSVSSIGASLIGATVNVTLTGGLIAKSVYFVRNQGITASAEL